MKSMLRLLPAMALLLCIAVGSASAESKWICSITEMMESSDGIPSYELDFEGITPPTFFYVDTEKKLITLLAPDSRRGETTVIDAARETTGGWFLSGVESERAWTMVLTNDGYMTVSITMDGTIRSAFGRCMPASHAKP